MIDYMLNPAYRGQHIQAGYWVDRTATTDEAGWKQSTQQFLADRQQLVDLLQHPETDVYSSVQAPNASSDKGYNLLRSIIVVAGHNTSHIGEFTILRGILQLW